MLGVAVSTSAQVKFVTPVLPVSPAVGKLALPVPKLAPTLGQSLLAAPTLTPVFPLVPKAVLVPKIGVGIPVTGVNGADSNRLKSSSGESLESVKKASAQLAVLADEIAAGKGLKIGDMQGKDFIAAIEQASNELSRMEKGEGTLKVRDSMVRIVRALIKPDLPLKPQMARLLSVWQVFDQELARVASETGSIEAVFKDAVLFAEQVENSV